MTIFESISEKFEQILYDDADPRIRNKPLMGSPLPVIAICIFYAFLIKVVMAKWMSARKAYKTRFLSLSLNSYLFSVSCYFLYKSSSLAWFKSYSWRCEPLDKSSSGDALEVQTIFFEAFVKIVQKCRLVANCFKVLVIEIYSAEIVIREVNKFVFVFESHEIILHDFKLTDIEFDLSFRR